MFGDWRNTRALRKRPTNIFSISAKETSTAPFFAEMTISNPVIISAMCARNTSRARRFHRFRRTARLSIFVPITKAIFVGAAGSLPATILHWMVGAKKDRPRFQTCSISFVFRNRCAGGNIGVAKRAREQNAKLVTRIPSISTFCITRFAFRCLLYAHALAALGAASCEHSAAILGPHADTETVGPCASALLWLECSLRHSRDN